MSDLHAIPDTHRSAVTPDTPGSQSISPGSTPSRSTSAGPPSISPLRPNRPLPPAPGEFHTGIQFPPEPLQTSPPQKSAAATGTASSTVENSNPFDVDLVIPVDISNAKGAAVAEVTAAYDRLINALQKEGGLRVTARPGRGGKGAEDVWVFIGATDGKVAELVARERIVDQAHGMRVENMPDVTPATRLRLLYELLTSPALQGGLGITPGEGDWSRVKAIVALHDDKKDAAWVERWTIGGDWKIGLLRGLGAKNGEMLAANQTPEVRLYFNFLTTYTLSLLPLAVVALGVWLKAPVDSYIPAFGFVLSLYACTFIAVWRIHQRKLAIRWGTRGCESVSVQLRPQYVISHGVHDADSGHKRNDLIRDAKVALSVPIILGCGALLACVLSGIFLLEAFVGHIYSGPGKAALPFLPMALFSLVVPQVVGVFNAISRRLVHWEDHPTFTGATKSLTAKTFAMNAIVAYLGLFLTAYVYLPFGPYIMAFIHSHLHKDGEKSSVPTEHHELINVARLKGQIFAYMVTNQVINTFLEVGLPYILRFVNDYRAGKASLKDALKGGADEKDGIKAADPEKRFLDKVAHELELPPYAIFTDYAEMVTQFGYVVVWGLVWPLAPVFALINNYFELRSDAIKICKHVRRPIGGRVESIGTWLDTMGIIAWVGAWTSTTLVYLFRPNPLRIKTNATLAAVLASYKTTPTMHTVISHILPVALAALAASHGFFVLRAVVTALAERILWRGSPEQRELDRGVLPPSVENEIKSAVAHEKSLFADRAQAGDSTFWTGPSQGDAEIRRIAKSE